MGGEVLLAFLPALFQTALNLLQEELRLGHGLEEERKNLVTNVSMIQAVLSEAEERQHTNGPLRLWLNVLRDVAYDAVDVLDKLDYEAQRCQLVSLAQVRHSLSLFNPKRRLIRYKMSQKIKDISQRLDDLQKQRVTFDLRVGDGGRHQLGGDELPTSTSLNPPDVFGRDNDKHRILEMLLRFDRMCQKSISVIPITGICGVGKTTLAQVVYNDEAVQKQFKERLWVDVSHDFNVKRLTKAIIESIDNSPVVDHISLDSLQKQLQKKLSGKRYLLVLDNVWNETTEEWQRLRLPLLFGAEGSKILVTTRSEEVAKIMGTTPPYMLKGLSDADCWTLFCQYALGQNPYQHSDIDDIANEILKKCKGLPLAAISKGNQLHRENDRSKWRSIVESERQEFSDYGSELGRAISLIYQQLPARLKPCLAYCSIFPKGHEFEKELIVQLWMAQNLIQSQGEHGEHVEDLGSRYIDFLVQRSLIECSQFDYKRGKQKYRVREFAHDFVQHVSGEECSVVEIGESCKVKTRHLSLTLSQFGTNDTRQSNSPAKSDIFEKIYPCKGLYTLLLLGGSSVYSLEVPKNLGKKLKSLRTLDLSNCNLKEELPKSIGDLKHLRCLQLHNTNVSRLPESLGCLFNLQTLGLRNCYSLEELPSDTKNLRKLRHLDLHLDDDSVEDRPILRSIPPEIGLLTDLQTLSRFVVGTKAGCGLGEMKNLNSLQGELIISNLHLVWNTEAAVKANLTNKKYIQSLQLRWCISTSASEGVGFDKSILTILKPHTNLKELAIIGYRAPSFPSWLGSSAFTNLTILHLSSCNKCESLPPLGIFPVLQELHIKGMERVGVVDCKFCGKQDGTFPNLKKLVFEGMPSLQVWDGDNDCVLPSLHELVIKDCTDLRKLVHSLPSLSRLKIEGCPRLFDLPRFQSLVSLEVASSGDWIWHSWPSLTSLTSLTLSRLPTEALPSVARSPLASLRSLEISYCDQLIALPDKWLPNGLVDFGIKHCPWLHALPIGLENLEALEVLEIQDCGQLEYLPELKNLTSLMHLEISDCPRVLYLPRNGLPTTLHFLSINNCPKLRERCQDERGKDWPKLAHILSVWIDGQLVISNN